MSEVEESRDHYEPLSVGETVNDLDFRDLIDHEGDEKGRDEELEIAGEAGHGRRRVSDHPAGSRGRGFMTIQQPFEHRRARSFHP